MLNNSVTEHMTQQSDWCRPVD